MAGEARSQAALLPPITVEPRAAPPRATRPAASPTSRAAARRPRRARSARPASPSLASRPGPGTPPAKGAVVAGNGIPSRTDLSASPAALPANATRVTSGQLKALPVFSYGDIFRPLAGFDVSNYGQGGVGYGLSLRGFTDAEHGRDIAYFVDGMPLNEVSSIHTPNYADLNPVLPESIATIDVIRGPFSVEYGDSNLGGAVIITTKTAEPVATIGVSGGSFGTLRSVATYSRTDGTILPFFAAEGFRSDDYRRNSGQERLDVFTKASVPLEGGATLSVRTQVYDNAFDVPSYINRDAVRTGLLSPRAAQNAADGGSKRLGNVVSNYVAGAPDDELSATLFFSHDRFTRFTDFGSGQNGQEEDRDTVGGRVRKIWTTSLFDALPTQVMVGGNWRSDAISVQAGPAVARRLTVLSSDLGIAEHNLAGFAQVQVKPLPWLKLTGGARFDQFLYGVSDRLNPAGSSNPSPHVLSPKAGVAVTPLSWLELYGNYGQGFRSPSAASELVDNPRLQPLKLESREVGAQIRYERWQFLVDAYTTDIDNEAFQPAPGLPVQNLGRSRRAGMDVEGKLAVFRTESARVSLFANLGAVEARLLGNPPARYVPNVPESVATTGTEFDLPVRDGERLTGTAYVSFVGRKFLDEDGSVRSSPYRRVSARIAYEWRAGWRAFAQATWYPGDRLSEAAFNFGPAIGATSADVFVSPMPRLTVLAGMSYGFTTGGR